MDELGALRAKTRVDITIAFTRSGRKCWLLRPVADSPFREQITPMLSRQEMKEYLSAEGGVKWDG